MSVNLNESVRCHLDRVLKRRQKNREHKNIKFLIEIKITNKTGRKDTRYSEKVTIVLPKGGLNKVRGELCLMFIVKHI